MNLLPLVGARQSLFPRPCWPAIFTKAWGRVAETREELRQLYMSRPFPRLYEHSTSVAAVVIERTMEREHGLFLAKLTNPGARSIREIDRWLRHCKSAPLNAIRDFRHAIRLARWPWFLRRFLWSWTMRWRPSLRAKQVGTFGISVTAGLGAATLAVRSPWTSCLHYGVIDSGGFLPVRLTFDHRVLDGATAARALVDLEAVLLGEVLDELRGLAQPAAA